MLLFKKWMSDKGVEKNYVTVGTWVGGAVSYAYLGEAVGMKRKVGQWEKWEQEYATRGYRTISLDRFVELGGYGTPLDDVLGKKREEGEEPIFHAKIYTGKYLGRVQPAIDLEKMMRDGQPQFGTWIRPSTKE